MTKVALLTHGYRLGGGVPSVARWLRDSLEATGHYSVEIYDLATSSNDGLSRRLARPRSWMRQSLQGIQSSEAEERHWGANSVELEFMRYRPRKELTAKLNRFDLVQVVAGSPAWGAVAAKVDVPVVLQVATRAVWERKSQIGSWNGLSRPWRRSMTAATTRIEDSAVRMASTVLVENSSMLEYVQAAGQSKVMIAPPGVDVSTFAPHPAGWQKSGPILSVCRLSDPRKGLDRLLNAYSKVRRSLKGAPGLVLAGRGPFPDDLRAQIEALGMGPHVLVRADVHPTELPNLYRSASVFIQGSHEEGLGLSALEAMASGLPVVSTETHGAREMVEPELTGHLVQQTSEDAVVCGIARRIQEVLEVDGEKMSGMARERCVQLFSSDATLRAFTRTYDSLLNA
ncbi:glycosyltransferase family 4 protein [Nucisporomicrobium flavum]|uniref:glycosyltransferase family 4 protein n=1 Tax=Nucisporomicrobium flavum TaxID=2785915 RepID=UPI0018F5C47F|nr:glycosyltransferase [Nucisporomicrobium flavum]